MDPVVTIFGLGIDPTIIVFGFGIGLLVGMTGMGGASLMTPLLILIFGIQPVTAIGTDIFYAAVTKTVGGWKHLKLGTVHKGLAFWLAVGSVPVGARRRLGDRAAAAASYGDDLDTLVLGMLGGTLVVVGVATLLRSLFLSGVIEERSAMHLYRRHIIAAVITGITTGFVIGLTSAGSGTLIAIALIAIFRLTPQRVVGTDVFHAAVLLWAAGIAHWVGGNIDFLLAGTILVGSIPGVIVGTNLSVKAPQKFLRYALAVVLIASGTTLIAKNYTPEIVLPAIGIASVMVGVLFGAQVVSRNRVARTPARRPPEPGRSAAPPDAAALDSRAMFVFASAVTDPDVYARAAEAGVARLREADPTIEQIVFASVGSIFRNYNLILDQVKDRDEVEALVLIHQDAEIQDPRVRRQGAGGARRPRGGDRRLRGRRGRPQHRLVGGLDHVGLVHPPLRRARRRRDPRLLLADRVPAPLRPPRRGRLDRRLRHGALALGDPQPALRRVAGADPRLRLRHLHAGARPPARRWSPPTCRSCTTTRCG